MPNALKKKRFNTWISSEELDLVNDFCHKRKTYRSTYMRDISLICIKHDLLPHELERILNQVTLKEH